MSDALSLIGVALQVTGVAVAGIGLATTWRDSAPREEHFLGPFTTLLGRIANRVDTLTRRLIRRPRPLTVSPDAAALGLGVAHGARVRVQYRVLPQRTTAKAAVIELDERTRDLLTRTQNTRESLEEVDEAVRRDLGLVRHRLDAEVARLDSLTHRIAIGGIRQEAAGLFLVAFGLLLQGFAGVV